MADSSREAAGALDTFCKEYNSLIGAVGKLNRHIGDHESLADEYRRLAREAGEGWVEPPEDSRLPFKTHEVRGVLQRIQFPNDGRSRTVEALDASGFMGGE